MYEPSVEAMARYFLIQLPVLKVIADRSDAWQSGGWDHSLVLPPDTLE
jgi:hypothetical protein